MQEKATEPAYYQQIFERGIDPDVEDPEKCHTHSEIPDEWPQLNDIVDYQERVRTRARLVIKEGHATRDRSIGEALWIGFEHEAMHLETFLYMLLQSDKTLSPTGVERPDFERMSHEAKMHTKPNKWFSIPQQTFKIGLNDCDEETVPKTSFGWDNEKPQREVTVAAFESQARPITNGEYAKYLHAQGSQDYPASWILTFKHDRPISKGIGSSGVEAGSSASPAKLPLESISIRTIFGPVPLNLAQDWPLSASYDEVARYAKWMDCRIPTFEEAKSIYHYSEILRNQRSWNGSRYAHLSLNEKKKSNLNDRDEVNGSTTNGSKTYTSEEKVFHDLNGCNVGFKNWHPIPVTPNGDRLAGQADMGGLWEWTSTPLMPQEGFKPMDIYPGYTCELHISKHAKEYAANYLAKADFFDGKHNVVLGGSWATFPRIAGRSTL